MRRLTMVIICIAMVFLTAGCAAGSNEASDIKPIQSYKDINGVSEADIAAIEALKESWPVFIYGQMAGTESFILPDGTKSGFAADFCALLTKLFGVEFRLELFDWETLKSGIDNMQLSYLEYMCRCYS